MTPFILIAALLATAAAAVVPGRAPHLRGDLPYAPTVITLSEAGQFVSTDG